MKDQICVVMSGQTYNVDYLPRIVYILGGNLDVSYWKCGVRYSRFPFLYELTVVNFDR
jgi:hypothetical protein